MNNKGFAITTILYGILVLFLLLLLSMMAILSTYKDRLQILIENTNGARDIINGNYIENENNNTGNYSYPADIVYLPRTEYRDDCPKGGDAERGICKDQSYEIYAEHDLCYTCQNGKVTKAAACDTQEIITCKEKNENWEKASYGLVEGSFPDYELNKPCSEDGEFRVEKGARYFAWCKWMGDYNAVPTEEISYYCPSGYTKDDSKNICYNCYNGGTYDSETQTCNVVQE